MVRVDIEVGAVCGGWIPAGIGFAPCPAGGTTPGAAAAGARVSSRARDFVCAGFPARGLAPERAVSLSGKPKSGVSLSTELVHGGQDSPGGDRHCKIIIYEPTK